jgi:hypothetical protein
MINIVNSSFLVTLSFPIMWLCPQWPLTTRAFSSSPFYKNLTCLAPFVSLDIITASSILSSLEPHTNVSANHFPMYLCMSVTVKILHTLQGIYAMINMVKSVFFHENMSQ